MASRRKQGEQRRRNGSHAASSDQSRFRVLKWMPAYLRWYFYAFATTFLRRPSSTVTMRTAQRSERTA